MLDYSTLKLKPITSKEIESGEIIYYKDLLSKTIAKNDMDIFSAASLIVVTDDYIARPDLISLAVYGNDDYADFICKINGISNPFELNSGMKLIIPDFSIINVFYKTGKPSETEKNNNISIASESKTNQKQKNERRSPGEQTIGDTLFKIDRDNLIVFY